MAKTPARKSSPKANVAARTPDPARELEPVPVSNPLLTEAAIHADLKPLFDAVVMVSAYSIAIAERYPDLLALKESRGLPEPEDWPGSQALGRDRAQYAEWVKAEREENAQKGRSVGVEDFQEPRWTGLMREWSWCYMEWCAAIAKAKELAESPAVAAIMDAGESRPTRRWTTQTIIDLDNLAGTLHPIQMGGVDGLGFIRRRLPPLPQEFPARAEAVRERVGELRAIPRELPPGFGPPSGGGSENGDAEPPPPPGDDDQPLAPALTVNQSRVLQTMAQFDPRTLVSADAIAAGMGTAPPLSPRTIGPIVRRLILLCLAERPEGNRSGARLTTAGRRLASKIAD